MIYWIVETLDAAGEIIDVDHWDDEFPAEFLEDPSKHIALVKDRGRHRSWAYVDNDGKDMDKQFLDDCGLPRGKVSKKHFQQFEKAASKKLAPKEKHEQETINTDPQNLDRPN